jgi:hypothetical protein
VSGEWRGGGSGVGGCWELLRVFEEREEACFKVSYDYLVMGVG